MKRTLLCSIAAAACVAMPAWATGTVTFILESSVNGQSVAPGATVDWSIRVVVSSGDNLGLALVACDLVQDANNPSFFALPPGNAASIPPAMAGFNRPGGITNPGEGGAPSGYIGVQRTGPSGGMNLIQIGGAQNTFGQPGTEFGTDPDVDGGIGQSGPQLIVSGSFSAPATTGTYVLKLTNGLANVLDTIGGPGQFSQVSQATVDLSAASISFDVSDVCLGDLDCDGDVDFDDIDPFVEALGGNHTACSLTNGDMDSDGDVDFDDIDPFVEALGGTPNCYQP